ncbi:MAG: ImmA/IrrE family metallo-endopeptidase [Planctomycetaceae bacterium]|nr:ImmA/IrrE family metallo-endopeptidase [Planctomycetaceae bacterium]
MVTYVEISQVLDELVENLQETTGLYGPAIDPFDLAERLRNSVLIDPTLPARGCRRELCGGVSSIVIAPDDRDERMCFATAHEIGEQHVANLCDRLGLSITECSERMREVLANRIASRLLVPNPWFRDIAVETDFDLFELKQTFPFASHQVISWRMLDVETPTIITIFDNGQRYSRKANFSGRHEMQSLEQHAWKQCRQDAEFVDVSRGSLRVQVWPIHEPDWKREIIRTTLLDWE